MEWNNDENSLSVQEILQNNDLNNASKHKYGILKFTGSDSKVRVLT